MIKYATAPHPNNTITQSMSLLHPHHSLLEAAILEAHLEELHRRDMVPSRQTLAVDHLRLHTLGQYH